MKEIYENAIITGLCTGKLGNKTLLITKSMGTHLRYDDRIPMLGTITNMVVMMDVVMFHSRVWVVAVVTVDVIDDHKLRGRGWGSVNRRGRLRRRSVDRRGRRRGWPVNRRGR